MPRPPAVQKQKTNLKVLALATTPQGIPLPVPDLEVNDGDRVIAIDAAESDEEDGTGLPDKPDGVDDEDVDNNVADAVCDKKDLVALALVKVSDLFWVFYFSQLIFDSNYRLILSVERSPAMQLDKEISGIAPLVWDTKVECSCVLVRHSGIATTRAWR